MSETITYRTLAGETDSLDRDAAEVVDTTYISPFGLFEIVRTASGQLIRVYEPEGNDHLRNPPEPEARELTAAEAIDWLKRHGREVPGWLQERGEAEAAEPAQYVTLDQAAAMVRRSKHTLKKYDDLPAPAVEGGGSEQRSKSEARIG